MGRPLARIGMVVAAVLLLYLMLRWASAPPQSAGDVPADTMCFAAKLGLRCAS